MNRRLLFQRDLVDGLIREVRDNGMPIKLAAQRAYWHGVPLEVSLRVFAGRA